jgi:hypothetical protein
MSIRQLGAIVSVAAFAALAITLFVRSGQLLEGAVRRSLPASVLLLTIRIAADHRRLSRRCSTVVRLHPKLAVVVT